MNSENEVFRIKEIINDLIKQSLQKLDLQVDNFDVFYTEDLNFGDLATNICMVGVKGAKMAPAILAPLIQKNLPVHKYIEQTTFVNPGFLNFKLSKYFFNDFFICANQDNIFKNDLFKYKNVLIEHSSPNLFKPFHIGHLMNNTIGISISRLYEYSGANIKETSFPSDVSLGIAKSICFIIEKYGLDFEPKDIDILGNAYVEGTKMYEENSNFASQSKKISNIIYSKKIIKFLIYIKGVKNSICSISKI